MRLSLRILGAEVFAISTGDDAAPDEGYSFADSAPLTATADGPTDTLGFQPSGSIGYEDRSRS